MIKMMAQLRTRVRGTWFPTKPTLGRVAQRPFGVDTNQESVMDTIGKSAPPFQVLGLDISSKATGIALIEAPCKRTIHYLQ